jgi:hypothetical protein
MKRSASVRLASQRETPNPHYTGVELKTIVKVFIGVILALVVVIVGCAALIGGAANEASKELDRQQQQHAITRNQFRSLRLGMSERQVRAAVGKRPENRQAFESEGILDEEPSRSSCIYYNRAGGTFGDSFQLCFENGHLSSKNSY